MPQAWDRLDRESPPAWEAFQLYRDAATTRTLEGVAKGVAKSLPLMKRWSAAYAWVERAAAWDRHLDQAVQGRLKGERLKRATQQANLGRAMQGVAGAALGKLAKKDLKASEVAALAKAGFEIERVAEGDPESRLALHGADGGGLEIRIVDVLAMKQEAKAVAQPAPNGRAEEPDGDEAPT